MPVQHAQPIGRLIQELTKLPGIGEKTASRLAMHILRAAKEYAQSLARAIIEVKEKIRLCSRCFNLTDQDPCRLCQDPKRNREVLCVVSSPEDLMALEKSGGFRGLYHVLHGVLSPLEGVGPKDLRVFFDHEEDEHRLGLRSREQARGCLGHPEVGDGLPALAQHALTARLTLALRRSTNIRCISSPGPTTPSLAAPSSSPRKRWRCPS